MNAEIDEDDDGLDFDDEVAGEAVEGEALGADEEQASE